MEAFLNFCLKMFYVAPSRLSNANEGLFAKRPIHRGKLIRLRPTVPRQRAEHAKEDCLNYYIPHDSDEASPCIVDGQLSTIKRARKLCRYDLSKPVVVSAPEEILMKANDLGWMSKTRNTPLKYQTRIRKNAFEFIVSVDREGVNGIYAYFTRDVRVEEEIGSTYGWEYWCSE